jgi:hypothetical protein
MTYTEFDILGSDANCKKGMPCGNSCISKMKKCKKGLGTAVAAIAEHITNPDNLEKGAGSSQDPLESFFQNGELDFDKDLNLVATSPEAQKALEKFNAIEEAEKAKEKEDDGDRTYSQKLNENAPPPTEEQAVAINTYTGSMYRDINGLLRGKKDFNDPEYEKEVQDIADKASEGLRSLPDYKGETYRGTSLDNSLIAKMKVGGTYSDKGFLSTSSDPKIADAFNGGNAGVGKTAVLFTIDGKHGKDISKASSYDDEKEILFNPNSKFKITSMEEKDGYLQVGMKQYGKQK